MLDIPGLTALHVTANVVWIGSIVAVAWVLAQPSPDSVARGRLALGVYRQLAVPAFLLSFVAGTVRLLLDLEAYFVLSKYMHGKLLAVLIVIALHHVVGARARSMAAGKRQEPGRVKLLGLGLLLSAAVAVFLVVLKPF